MERPFVARAILFITLGETHLWAAIRYVERNPVRVKMVTKAEDY
ncbi:hypothetical protein [Nitrosomonas sp. Is37]|nr:hypothetical protein [Nitrosomonas sp. Is37]